MLTSLPFQLPSQKECAAGVGGILAFAIILGLHLCGISFGAAADASLDGALVVLLPAAIAKLVPPADVDVLNHINDDIAQAGTLIGKLTPASDSDAPASAVAIALAATVTGAAPPAASTS